MRRIRYPETGGSIVCLAAATFIGSQFYRLDNVVLQGAGITSVLLLLLLPVLSWVSLKQLTLTGNPGRPYAEGLKVFAFQKLRFYRLQKWNVTLSCLLLVTLIILLPALFGSRRITSSPSFWLFSFTIGYIFLLLFSAFVSRSYRNTIRQVEELLQEIESDIS